MNQEKGGDLQQEVGAELTVKKRLKEKSGSNLGGGLPAHGGRNRNRRKYHRHTAKMKEYARPYKSSLVDDIYDKRPAEKTVEADITDIGIGDNSEAIGILYVPDSPIAKKSEKTSPVKQSANLSEKPSKLEQKESTVRLEDSKTNEPEKQPVQVPRKQLITEGSRWKATKYEERPYSKRPYNDSMVGSSVDSIAVSDDISPEKTDEREKNISTALSEAPAGKKLKTPKSKFADKPQSVLEAQPKNRLKRRIKKKLMATVPVVPIAPETPDSQPVDVEISAEIHEKQKDFNRKKQYAAEHGERTVNLDKPVKPIKSENSFGLKFRQEETVAAIPVQKPNLRRSEVRWSSPQPADKPKNAKDVKGNVDVTGQETVKNRTTTGSLVTKSTLVYGSKLIINEAHRQVREDIRQNGDNEVLRAAHWAEQKGEQALGQGMRKLNPVSVSRYIKNTPYRRESKLKIRKLKNDKKLGLLRVKQDKASGINHMTGKKSNAVTRAWQKRQIKKNYQKAVLAANGKGGGSLGAIVQELVRGNPKAIVALAAKKITFVATKYTAKITVFNPVFWKLMVLVLLFLIILGSVQACVAIFNPSLAGVGFVSDEDIEFSTRIYSEWETDLEIFLRESNITEEYPPPAHITNQPGVDGEVVYPLYPYSPPPPFYEFRFEIGMIGHDPMELISYLTAAHGERFDEDSDNPMTHSDLEAILREIFEAQYGIAPGEFGDLVTTEEETRFRRERRWEQIGTEPDYGYVYYDIYYQFWIVTVNLTSRSLSDVLRNRMTEDEELHFDVLNLTGNGRQIVGNPFDFNWIPNITSHYGYRVHPIQNDKQFHLGIDIAAPLGAPIFATHTGEITQVQFSNTGYGNMLRLRGEGTDGVAYYTLFAHLDEIHVTQGQAVEQSDLIATVGNTGDSTGPHLHLEVIRPAQTVTIHGETISLTEMHLNPLFAVITWTDEQSNEAFRPAPGAGGIRQSRPPFFPEIPPEAMTDERFVAILTEASRHLGARYVWGAIGPTTFDCSGFIHFVYSTALPDWTHGRTTAQGYFDMSIPVSPENARPGDLIFFHSTFSSPRFITHIGIYIGNGQMIHTGGNPAGVEFVSINTPFWQRHFHAFGRV